MGPGRPLQPRSPRHHVHVNVQRPPPRRGRRFPPPRRRPCKTATASRALSSSAVMRRCRTSITPSSSKGWFTCRRPFRIDITANPHFNLIGWLVDVLPIGTPGVEGGDNSHAPARPGQRPAARRLPDRPAVARRTGADRRRRLYRGGRRNWSWRSPLSTASIRSARQARRLPPQRRPRIRRLARVRPDRSTGSSSAKGATTPGRRLPPICCTTARPAPGLWLDPAALIRGEMAAVARTTQQGLASAEHAAFVDRLRQAAARNPS